MNTWPLFCENVIAFVQIFFQGVCETQVQDLGGRLWDVITTLDSNAIGEIDIILMQFNSIIQDSSSATVN